MIYKLYIPDLIDGEQFETDETIVPLTSNIIDWSIEPDTLEIILDPSLPALKSMNVDIVDYLSTNIDGYGVLKLYDNTIETIGSDMFSVGDTVWCENEPMYITYKNSSTSYTVERPYPRNHIYDGLITKDYPISIIGTFGYIMDGNNDVVKWIYVNSLSTSGAGAIIEVEDILSLYDNDYPIINNINSSPMISTSSLLDNTGLGRWIRDLSVIDSLNYMERWENSNYFASCNPFEALMNNLKLSGKILRFNKSTGLFNIISPQQPDIFNSNIISIDLDNEISYNGGYSYQALTKGVKVEVKANIYNNNNGIIEKGNDLSFSLNFGSSFNSSIETIESDFTSIVPYDSNGIITSEIDVIAWFRNKLLNGVVNIKQLSYGILTIITPSNHTFEVGNFYTPNDVHLFELFLKTTTDLYLLCIQSSTDTIKFLVLYKYLYSPVSPALICKYIGNDGTGNGYGLQLMNSDYEDVATNIYQYFNRSRGTTLEDVNVSGTLTYESKEYVRTIRLSTSGSINKQINKIVGNIIYLTSGSSMYLNEEYLIFFPSSQLFSTDKQEKYLWVNGGVNV